MEELQNTKLELLRQFNELAKLKKELYSDMDIETPMSAEEKELNRELSNLASQMNNIVRQIRSINPIK